MQCAFCIACINTLVVTLLVEMLNAEMQNTVDLHWLEH